MKSYIIKKPLITEKTLDLANQYNVYTFIVSKQAGKDQIKEAIERLFSVKVEAIRTMTHYRVMKRTGRKRMPVMLAPTKKALVQLKKGDKIELFDLGGSEKSDKSDK